MKIALKIAGGLLLVLVLVVAGAYVWAGSTSNRILTATFQTHSVDFPIPFPLADDEIAELALDAESAERLAWARAVERGEHLVTSRYPCGECHGENMGGGVMMDAFPIGTLLGPNITTGAGSRTLEYTAADWDRTVRHGVLPDGRPSAMPSEDFRLMSDQELSDVIAYVRSLPPVDNAVPAPTLGPLGKVLLATGQIKLSVNLIDSHDTPHRVYPPASEPTIEFGEHIAMTCTGCHGGNLAGGPIVGGDPSWAPARNLTPDPSGLASWSYADFVTAMREGTRPDGTALLEPMTFVMPYAQRMTDVEMEAVWAYLRSIPAVPQN
jgi:mono/diheme cytochrome c family protein